MQNYHQITHTTDTSHATHEERKSPTFTCSVFKSKNQYSNTDKRESLALGWRGRLGQWSNTLLKLSTSIHVSQSSVWGQGRAMMSSLSACWPCDSDVLSDKQLCTLTFSFCPVWGNVSKDLPIEAPRDTDLCRNWPFTKPRPFGYYH